MEVLSAALVVSPLSAPVLGGPKLAPNSLGVDGGEPRAVEHSSSIVATSNSSGAFLESTI